MWKRVAVCVLLFGGTGFTQQAAPGPAGGDNAALLDKIRELEDRVIALEGQMRIMKSQAAASPSTTSAASAATTAPTTAETQTQAVAASAPQEPVHLGGAGTAAAKALNPDISMIGDFIGTTGQNRFAPAPVMEMHESELGVQAIIDPYARGDFFVSFGEE